MAHQRQTVCRGRPGSPPRRRSAAPRRARRSRARRSKRQPRAVPELARDVDHRAALVQQQRGEVWRSAYGVASSAPSAPRARSKFRERQLSSSSSTTAGPRARGTRSRRRAAGPSASARPPVLAQRSQQPHGPMRRCLRCARLASLAGSPPQPRGATPRSRRWSCARLRGRRLASRSNSATTSLGFCPRASAMSARRTASSPCTLTTIRGVARARPRGTRTRSGRAARARRRSRQAGIGVCPRVLAIVSARILRSASVALQPVTSSQVVGSTVSSITSVSTRPPSSTPIRNRRAPDRADWTTTWRLRGSCVASSERDAPARELRRARVRSRRAGGRRRPRRAVYRSGRTDSRK